MTKSRRRYSPTQKAVIVRQHLLDKVAVSDLADEQGIQPSQIHLWVKQVVEQAEKAFERGEKRRKRGTTQEDGAGLRQALAEKDKTIVRLAEMLTGSNSPSGFAPKR